MRLKHSSRDIELGVGDSASLDELRASMASPSPQIQLPALELNEDGTPMLPGGIGPSEWELEQRARADIVRVRAAIERLEAQGPARQSSPEENAPATRARSRSATSEDGPNATSLASSAPLYLSQKTALATTGIDPRRYLDLLRRADCPLEVIRRGKLRLVEREAFERWLRELDRERAGDRSPARPRSDGADAVLRELGLVPAPKQQRT